MRLVRIDQPEAIRALKDTGSASSIQRPPSARSLRSAILESSRSRFGLRVRA